MKAARTRAALLVATDIRRGIVRSGLHLTPLDRLKAIPETSTIAPGLCRVGGGTGKEDSSNQILFHGRKQHPLRHTCPKRTRDGHAAGVFAPWMKHATCPA